MDFSQLITWLTPLMAQQQSSGAAAPAGPPLQQLVFIIVVMGAAFYLLILRPQSKERKERDRQLASLAKGDTVITVGGIHGLITKVTKDGKTAELEVARNIRFVINKSAVASIVKKGSGKAGDEAEGEAGE